MKKVLYTLFMGVLLFCVGTVHAQETCPELNSFDIFSPKGSNAVYMLNQNEQMVPFPNDDVYKSWFEDYRMVKEVDPVCITFSMPGKAPFFVNYRSGVRIVKRPLSPKLYIIERGNILKPIDDEKILVSWYGKDWPKLVRDLSDDLIMSYERVNEPVRDARPFEGMYIEKDGVDYIVSHNMLRKTEGKLPMSTRNAVVKFSQEMISIPMMSPSFSEEEAETIFPLKSMKGDFISYENNDLGFHLEYPSEFEVVEGSFFGDNIISFVSPQENDDDLFYESFSVLVDTAEGTLQEYTNSIVTQLQNYFTDFNLIDSTLLAPKDGFMYPAQALVYRTTQFGKEIRTLQFVIFHDEQVYLLTFVIPEEAWSQFSETVAHVGDSFRILEGGTSTNMDEEVSQVYEDITFAPIHNTQDHIIGNPDSKITILEYTDLQCPYCASFHETTNKILDTYNGKVRLVVRHFPLSELHEQALPLAAGAECAAKQGKFAPYLDAVFADQQEAGTQGNTFLARKMGLNMLEFNLCLQDKRTKEAVLSDREDALGTGANGTPYSLLIGPKGEVQIISGAQSYETVSAMIDAML